MLARLQQFTTLGLIAAAIGWAVVFALRGQPALAGVGALLIVFGYALFLGLEFVLLARSRGGDPAPRASAGQMLRAWWGEVCYAPCVFCWRQPFRATAEPDCTGPQSLGRCGVVFVHGFVCNRALWNPWMARLRKQGVPFSAVNLEPVFGSIDDYPPVIEAAVQCIESATGLAPVIVAHSMGGLAVRAWLAAFAADARVKRVITIGTPHGGTWLARFALTPNGLQMRQQSPWLRQMAAQETSQRRARFTCYYGHCDNIVFPASTAALIGADNRHLEATAHVHMAGVETIFEEVLQWLSRPGDQVAAGHAAAAQARASAAPH